MQQTIPEITTPEITTYANLIEKAELLEQYALRMFERDRNLSLLMKEKANVLRKKARLHIIDSEILSTVRNPLHY